MCPQNTFNCSAPLVQRSKGKRKEPVRVIHAFYCSFLRREKELNYFLNRKGKDPFENYNMESL